MQDGSQFRRGQPNQAPLEVAPGQPLAGVSAEVTRQNLSWTDGTGEAGATGATGAEGPQGPAGPPGSAGSNASIILSDGSHSVSGVTEIDVTGAVVSAGTGTKANLAISGFTPQAAPAPNGIAVTYASGPNPQFAPSYTTSVQANAVRHEWQCVLLATGTSPTTSQYLGPDGTSATYWTGESVTAGQGGVPALTTGNVLWVAVRARADYAQGATPPTPSGWVYLSGGQAYVAPAAPLPTGADTQTMRFNGTTLTTTSGILNNGSQVAIGGSIDTGSRLKVSPQGAAENGITIQMPVSPTGFYLQGESSSGVKTWSIAPNGTPDFPGSATYSQSVGYLSTATGIYSTAYGVNSGAGGTGSVAVGLSANASGPYAVAIGYAASAASGYTFALGENASSNYPGCVAIGGGAQCTAANQFVVGAAAVGYQVSDVYFGGGVTNPTVVGTTIHATGGSGTNIAGASMTIAGGQSTGSGAEGVVNIATSGSGATGTSQNALVNRVAVSSSGLNLLSGSFQVGSSAGLTTTTGGLTFTGGILTGGSLTAFTPAAVAAPSTVTGYIASYNSSTAYADFQANFSADVSGEGGGDTRWQYSTDGSTWKGPDTTSATWYTVKGSRWACPTGYSSGNLYGNCKNVNAAGSASGAVASGAVAYVVPASGGSSTLAADTDVTITSPSVGQVLVYGSGGKWQNGVGTASGGSAVANGQYTYPWGSVTTSNGLIAALSGYTSFVPPPPTKPAAGTAIDTGQSISSGIVGASLMYLSGGAIVTQPTASTGTLKGSGGVTSGSTLPQYGTQNQLSGLIFNNTSGQEVDFGSQPTWSKVTGAMSLACLVSVNALHAAFSGIVLCDTSGHASPYGLWGIYITNSNTIRAHIAAGGSAAAQVDSATITAGNLYHCVMTYDGSSTLTLYVNGVSAGTYAVSGAVATNGYLALGNFEQATTNPFDGLLDHFILWNRCLSSSEVTNLATYYYTPWL